MRASAPTARTPEGRGSTGGGAPPTGPAVGPSRAKPFLFVGLLVVLAGAILYAVSGGKVGRTAAGTNTALLSAGTTQAPPASPTPAPSPPPPRLPLSAAGPKIVFATPIYDFGKINGGDVAKHDFIFTNVGNAVLEVTNVHASCGCTTAGDWTRRVEPGQTGSIPIQFNSTGFSGAVGKSITVSCNDTSQPTVVLQIKGAIWRPIDLTPQFAVLNVNAEVPSNSTTVRIVNNVETPLTLSPPEINQASLGVELRTNQPGKEYELVVRTIPPLPPGHVSGQITVKTSSTNMPVLNISAWVNTTPLLQPIPAQITLASAPLTNATPITVHIRNNSTNAVKLSEPTVNAPGVEVQLTEVQPGRFFTATLNFPVGFETLPGQKVELNLKSDHALFPMVTVPVTQPPRPAAPPPPAPGPAAPSAHAAQPAGH